ncbi:MAG: hypothetical protein EBQ92_01440 [Proteobacteria bacterium]|jgi:hypothetical protein|nr:hypothetical protein [Pseudomonadota bacterium]
MIQAITLLIFLAAIPAQAKLRTPPPLLPERESASTLPQPGLLRTQKKASRSELSAIGFEIGSIGVKNTSSGDIIGLQLLYGLRANLIYPLTPRLFLKPSLGYFLKPQREGDVSITQNLIEAGLGFQYALVMKNGFLWHAGLSQRVDYLFSRIEVRESSANTPALFRYRAGTSTGLRFKISPKSDLTFDLEAGVTPFDNFRIQTGFSSGIIFFID